MLMEPHQLNNGSSPNAQEPETQRNTVGATNPDEEIPACHSCRKRKLKCSREFPSCSHCLRLDTTCSYNHKKNKPGIKAGAVESLNRRVERKEALENALLRQDENDAGSVNGHRNGRNDQGAASCIDVLRVLAHELKRTGSNSSSHTHDSHRAVIESPSSSNGRAFSSFGGDTHTSPRAENFGRKRRRINNASPTHVEPQIYSDELHDSAAQLPPEQLMNAIVDTYFARIHPWIPMLHQSLFLSRLHDPQQRLGLTVILHAMVTAALRYVDEGTRSMMRGQTDGIMKKSRNTVILMAFDGLSVENLQALTIITFDDMGKGQASKAWSIVGSLTRTVEYLQLSVEMDDHEREPVLKPLSSLTKTHNWTETEERRRVFWVIFLLDRFCSVTTGWNTSLTSDDVRRRLPCDGGLWAEEEPVITPYFGIWDKSAAKIGKSIAFIPAHYPSPSSQRRENDLDNNYHQSPSASDFRPGSPVDLSTLGAFAYCIEATESLSQVTTFFLQQKVNFRDRQEVGSWLTRFKELDLRLVHWKMFLPQKWKDSNISREPAFINMDPNLTMAHITHNSSMILLHQRIAYPPPDWSEIVKLPSFCSAETCQLAAVETANIAQKYLKYTPAEGIVSSQFIFCVFVSARVLLIHWQFYNSKLFPEFWVLVECLEELSSRWRCCQQRNDPSPQSSLDQAMKYARQLRELHERCSNDSEFQLDVFGYSNEMSFVHEKGNNHGEENTHGNYPPTEIRSMPNSTSNNGHHVDTTTNSNQNELERQLTNSNNLLQPTHIPPEYSNQPTSHPHLPRLSIAPNYPTNRDNTLTPPPGSSDVILTPTYPPQQSHHMAYPHHQHTIPPPSATSDDELSLISHTLMGQQFLKMDRVISFDDTTFVLDCMGGGAGGGGESGQIGGAWAPAPPAVPQETGAVGAEYGDGA